MSLGISFLGSGSSGNSLVIHSDQIGIMFDAGFSRAEIMSRLNSLNIKPEIIKALVLSHEHLDHSKGARVFADKMGIPTYATTTTAKILLEKSQISANTVMFEPGAEFELFGFRIRSFSVPHDAQETVGFSITKDNIRIGVATDLGHMTALCEQRLKGCSVLILESNHDIKMQMNSKRDPNLIKRVLGNNGHLSNDCAAEALERIITKETSKIFLVHISRECNEYDIVEKTAREKLAQMGRQDILLEIATQEPLKTVFIN
ncbi:MAG TPA: MBL fold metallo-hydrolase [Victivallales bacterium]|nr:MBL fold metallo-hydrolase [Victivallales bacterium]